MHIMRIGAGQAPAGAAGYALLEALIAVVVATVGFIGAARMQTAGMALGSSAQSRQKATLLGYQMTDRIRANRAGFELGLYNNATAGAKDCLSDGTGCSPTQLAAADMREWLDDLAAQLPQGQGVVCKDSTIAASEVATPAAPACDGVGDAIAVKIWWTEKGTQSRFVSNFRP